MNFKLNAMFGNQIYKRGRKEEAERTRGRK
jgi:hypothetical protein